MRYDRFEYANASDVPAFTRDVRLSNGVTLFVEVKAPFDYNAQRKLPYWAYTDLEARAFTVGVYIGADEDCRLEVASFVQKVGYQLDYDVCQMFEDDCFSPLFQSGVANKAADMFKLATAARVAICELIEWADNARRGTIVQETP